LFLSQAKELLFIQAIPNDRSWNSKEWHTQLGKEIMGIEQLANGRHIPIDNEYITQCLSVLSRT
jgi:hypothetical protein